MTETRLQRFVAFRRVFGTPDGGKVLEALDQLASGVVLRPGPEAAIDPFALAVAHGRREVVQFIRDQIAAGEKLDE